MFLFTFSFLPGKKLTLKNNNNKLLDFKSVSKIILNANIFFNDRFRQLLIAVVDVFSKMEKFLG